MKQAIIVVPLFLLLLTILYLFIPVFPATINHESFFSPDAQIVISQYDLQDRVSELASSPLGQTVANLRYEIVGKELGLTDDEIAQFLHLKEDIKNSYQNPLVQMLIGREVSIALLPFVADESVDFFRQLTNHLLIVSRPSKNARLMDVATWAISSDERISTVRYGAHTITRFDLEDGRRLSVVRVKDLVVMGLNERLLRQGIDLYDSGQGGLRENKEYLDKIEHFAGASLVGYFNFDGLTDILNRAILESSDADGQLMLLDKSKIEVYNSAIFGAWREGSAIVDKAIVTFEQDRLDESSETRLRAQPGLPQSHKKVSPDTIIFHWSNQFSPEILLGMVGQEQFGPDGSDGSIEENFIKEIARINNITVQQFFDLFDNDLTLAVRGINEEQLVPLPRFLLSVKSGEVEKLKEVVDTIIEHYSIPVRRKSYDGTDVISWGGIIGIGAVLPTLSFTEDAVIVSSNRRQIQNFIAPQREHSLAELDTFQSVSGALLKPSHSITYLDFAQTAEMLQEMVSWGGTMLALKDRDLARKSKVLIDELINPLLEGVSMYSIIGSRKYQEGNTIVFESITHLDHGNQ